VNFQDEEKLLTRYTENADLVHKESGVERPKALGVSEEGMEEIMCSICFEDEKDAITGLSCKHYFCNGCWKSHLTIAIKVSSPFFSD
jgi:hypothetical protein